MTTEPAVPRRTLTLQPVGGLQSVGVLGVAWRRVPVAGGDLAVAVWGEPTGGSAVGEPVLAVHGPTGNALVWAGVAGLLDGRPPLLAPDLRGRGASAGLPGPYGPARSAEDLLGVLDQVGLERVVLAAHGAGARTALALTEIAPDRVSRVVLVDPAGDPSEPAPVATDVFPSREEHRRAWRDHLSLPEPWNGLVTAMVAHDALGQEPRVRSASSSEAVRADAETGAFAVPEPRVPVRVVTAGETAAPGVGVSGTTHWTLLLGLRGADAVARSLSEA